LGSDHAYAELGLAPGASESEVKGAWRRLASLWHPDRNPSAAAMEKMQRINRALEQIRRSSLADDAMGPTGNTASDRAPGGDDTAGGDAPGAKRGSRAGDAPAGDTGSPSRTLSRKVKLTLEEAAAGCIKVMRGKVIDRCESCAGAGCRLPGGACPECAGAGAVRQRAWFGWFGVAAECAACDGDGMERLVCDACEGTGKLPARDYRVDVRIPHGVRDGDLLHAGGRKPRPGHLDVRLDLQVELVPHALFELAPDGTVHCEVPVDGFAWIANRSIDVPTLTGLQRLQLSREQLSYRLSGQGFPVDRRGPRGDQLVRLRPAFPERFSADQNILIDQLVASASSPDGSPSAKRLADWRKALRAWEQARTRREH
jgi:molecular chaperone DnaJ